MNCSASPTRKILRYAALIAHSEGSRVVSISVADQTAQTRTAPRIRASIVPRFLQ